MSDQRRVSRPDLGAGSAPSIDSLAASSPFLFFALEKDGTIRVINPAAEAAFGSPRAELEGDNVLDLLHPDERLRMKRALSDSRESLEGPMTFRVGFSEKHPRMLRVWLHCHPDSERILVWGRDTTESRGRVSRGPEPGRRSRSGGVRGAPGRREPDRPPRMTMARFEPTRKDPIDSESGRESGTEARSGP